MMGFCIYKLKVLVLVYLWKMTPRQLDNLRPFLPFPGAPPKVLSRLACRPPLHHGGAIYGAFLSQPLFGLPVRISSTMGIFHLFGRPCSGRYGVGYLATAISSDCSAVPCHRCGIFQLLEILSSGARERFPINFRAPYATHDTGRLYIASER